MGAILKWIRVSFYYYLLFGAAYSDGRLARIRKWRICKSYAFICFLLSYPKHWFLCLICKIWDHDLEDVSYDGREEWIDSVICKRCGWGRSTWL